jgi:thioredoxin-like negative regulator of GroEL
MNAGQKGSAEKVLAKFENLERAQGRPPSAVPTDFGPGLYEQTSATLPLVRKLAAANPADWRLKFRLADDLLGDGRTEEALKVFREIQVSASAKVASAECGRAPVSQGGFVPVSNCNRT